MLIHPAGFVVFGHAFVDEIGHRLHRAAMPVLLIRGESDGLVSADYLEAYARLLPNASMRTIPAAGHVPHLEQPEAFASAAVSRVPSCVRQQRPRCYALSAYIERP